MRASEKFFEVGSPEMRFGCRGGWILALHGALLLLSWLPSNAAAQETGVAVVDGSGGISATDDNYVCATLDWWPPEKCNYGQCPWGKASILNLDIRHPLLVKAMQAFQPLRIRVGGSLQDRLIYEEPGQGYPCQSFKRKEGELFGFTRGCLGRERWDAVNQVFQQTGVVVTFGLNALYGRYQGEDGAWKGEWNSSNARSFIKYTISKGYPVDSWELGNELSGHGVGATVGVRAYANDLIKLKELLVELYDKSASFPKLLAPGGFYEQRWYDLILDYSGPNVIDGMTHHIYNLGAGNDPRLFDRMQSPEYLQRTETTFRDIKSTVEKHGPTSSPWVSEAGGAYNSGGKNLSDTFLDSFWYLDQLGMAAKHNTKVYCRQVLVGGNYGLLDTGSFVPNPDYYSALLWHRLMGKTVLSVENNVSPSLRIYAHCAKKRDGVSLAFINYNRTKFDVDVVGGFNGFLIKGDNIPAEASSGREEYHLTGKDGNCRSRTMILNGSPLQITETGDIPEMNPMVESPDSPVSVAPMSIAFVVLPYFQTPACA